MIYMEVINSMIQFCGHTIDSDLIAGVGPLLVHSKDDVYRSRWLAFTLYLSAYAIEIKSNVRDAFSGIADAELMKSFQEQYRKLQSAVEQMDFTELLVEKKPEP